jgi:hypothetical protein
MRFGPAPPLYACIQKLNSFLRFNFRSPMANYANLPKNGKMRIIQKTSSVKAKD